MKKIFKWERTIAKYARPVIKRVSNIPLPGDDYFEAIAALFKRLKGVDKVLSDPDITTVRLVTNPEKIVLKETQRAFMYFCLYKMNIDGIIMNRILPDDAESGYFKDWSVLQKQYILKAEELFRPIPIFPVNLFNSEVIGYDNLKGLADKIYIDQDPLKHFFKGEPYNLIKEKGGYKLLIKLPFLIKKDIELNKISDELIIRIGSFKRHILLPRQVAASTSIKATMEEQYVAITFQGDDHD